jgi:hypothetical protein
MTDIILLWALCSSITLWLLMLTERLRGEPCSQWGKWWCMALLGSLAFPLIFACLIGVGMRELGKALVKER